MSHTTLKILISGASGLVGSALSSSLKKQGHQVTALRRGMGTGSEGTIFWNPTKKEAICSDFEGFDAVVHLAGKSIASIPWTKKTKEKIYTSRVDDTLFLSQILTKLRTPPKTLICASAVGFYGNRKKEILTEESGPGTGFLAEVCRDWEEASKTEGIRVVQARFGNILSKDGGFLKKIVPPFRFALGATFGNGEQIMSWIALEDVVGGILHSLRTDSLDGPVNFTTNFPETNASFSQKLANALHRPLFMKIPKKVLLFVFGEMGREMFLAGSHVIPQKLVHSGYKFQFPTMDDFLKQHFS